MSGLQSTRRAKGGSRQSLIISYCPDRRPQGQPGMMQHSPVGTCSPVPASDSLLSVLIPTPLLPCLITERGWNVGHPLAGAPQLSLPLWKHRTDGEGKGAFLPSYSSNSSVVPGLLRGPKAMSGSQGQKSQFKAIHEKSGSHIYAVPKSGTWACLQYLTLQTGASFLQAGLPHGLTSSCPKRHPVALR